MGKKVLGRTLTGVTTDEVRDYEVRNRAVARSAAADGIVLLKNEGGVLPLDKNRPIALYGAGAAMTIKGGSGSGDVNSRPSVSVWEGLEAAGYTITTQEWLRSYVKEYNEARQAWKDEIWRKVDAAQLASGDGGVGLFQIYSTTTFISPAGPAPKAKLQGDDADTALLVLARTAGEGADRFNAKGDYLLTDSETELVYAVCSLYAHVVLVLNTGGLIDLGFTEDETAAGIDAIVYMHQAGMEGGSALADVLSGDVTPSAKLTDTWALDYADYPSSATFSHNNGDVLNEKYVEGLYVGYRYFDTFGVPVRYGFGYGLSYTTFAIRQIGVSHYDLGTANPSVGVRVCVTNTGTVKGREVVQVYASCPQEKQEKEFRRLVGYGKTGLLAPGASQELEITFPLYGLASYDEAMPGWILEAGEYILMVGNSLADAQTAGVIRVMQDLVFYKTENICTPKEPVKELEQSEIVKASLARRRAQLLEAASAEEKPVITLHEGDVKEETIVYSGAHADTPQEVRDFVDTLSVDQLILLATGDIAKGQGMEASEEEEETSSEEGGGGALGSAGSAVPGSAAQTSDCAAAQGLPDIVLADGPAGLRLTKSYDVVKGIPRPASLLAALEGGFLIREEDKDPKAAPADEVRYQFCTAFPVGTQLAQSWDPEVIAGVGKAVGEELLIFGVTLWLAPGMNIHRNPLCGRNFEYYSEDPLVSGLCAAAMTDGVQSVKGVGTTIKHFACNNQEDNRMGSNSILSERVLREIYLKGFEIAVKKSQPMSIMTSYNLINGVHAANNYDTCTKAARCEWGFKGVIMTDWTTTMVDESCTASGCMRAGNDLVMPGAVSDHVNMRKELEAGTLPLEDLKRSIARLVCIAWQSNYVEEV